MASKKSNNKKAKVAPQPQRQQKAATEQQPKNKKDKKKEKKKGGGIARTVRLVVFVILIAIVVQFVIAANQLNAFTFSYPPVELDCKTISTGIHGGSEDLTYDADTGLALISSCYHILEVDTTSIPHEQGIFSFPLRDANHTHFPPTATMLKITNLPDSTTFNCPHGISLYTSNVNNITKKYLFVVNHEEDVHIHTILKFEWLYNQNTLVFLHRYYNPQFILSPNDVAVLKAGEDISSDEFMFTNDHSTRFGGFWAKMEAFLGLKSGDIVLYSKGEYRSVLNGFFISNGMAVDRFNSSLVYMAELGARRLHVLKWYRDSRDEIQVEKVKEVNDIGFMDNLEMDMNGDLWSGASPQPLKFLLHSMSPYYYYTPSEVIKIDWRKGNHTVVYRNKGEQISSSSCAVALDDKLLIGAVLHPRLLLCKL